MNIRLEGTKEELENAIFAISKITESPVNPSRLYPNRGNDQYRIYLNSVIFKKKIK